MERLSRRRGVQRHHERDQRATETEVGPFSGIAPARPKCLAFKFEQLAIIGRAVQPAHVRYVYTTVCLTNANRKFPSFLVFHIPRTRLTHAYSTRSFRPRLRDVVCCNDNVSARENAAQREERLFRRRSLGQQRGRYRHATEAVGERDRSACPGVVAFNDNIKRTKDLLR